MINTKKTLFTDKNAIYRDNSEKTVGSVAGCRVFCLSVCLFVWVFFGRGGGGGGWV